MRIIFVRVLPFVFFIAANVLFLRCSSDQPDKKVKIIEERDPIVKIIEEKDSLVIKKNDTVTRIIY